MDVTLIGDPHLGKRFITGVPLERRGEREKEVRQTLLDQVLTSKGRKVIVGDLFNKQVVPYEDLLFAIRLLSLDDQLFVIAGNHDVGHDLEKVTALQILRECFPQQVIMKPRQFLDLALFPWEEDRTAEEQVEHFPQQGPVRWVIGHWDEKAYNGKSDHVVPVAAIHKRFGAGVTIASGHVHKPHKTRDVHFVGSLQPYAHGEDADDAADPRYVTVRAEDL